jgi:hypothetical protein
MGAVSHPITLAPHRAGLFFIDRITVVFSRALSTVQLKRLGYHGYVGALVSTSCTINNEAKEKPCGRGTRTPRWQVDQPGQTSGCARERQEGRTTGNEKESSVASSGIMKKCSKCKIEKRFSEFYRNKAISDGFSHYCKKCFDLANGKSRKNNPDRPTPPSWLPASQKVYRDNHPEMVREKTSKWVANNPHKKASHIVVAQALYSGSLKKLPCENCGMERVDAHHEDYTKPLDVRWLCRKHHKARHAELLKL